MPSHLDLAADLRAALRPLTRRLLRSRTISLGKSGIMNRLNDHGAATASELAAAEQITPQAVAVALKELEDLSFVTRARDDVDRRRVYVELTDAGRAALKTDREDGTRWLADALDTRLDDADRQTLADAVIVLRRLIDAGDDE